MTDTPAKLEQLVRLREAATHGERTMPFMQPNGQSTIRNVVETVMMGLGANNHDFRLRDRLIGAAAHWFDTEAEANYAAATAQIQSLLDEWRKREAEFAKLEPMAKFGQRLFDMARCLTECEHDPEQPQADNVDKLLDGWMSKHHENQRLIQQLAEREAEVERLKAGLTATESGVADVLGRALGYPKFADDQKNFPGATDTDGICVGDHVAESLAAEAAARIASLESALAAHKAKAGKLEAAVVKAIAELRHIQQNESRYGTAATLSRLVADHLDAALAALGDGKEGA